MRFVLALVLCFACVPAFADRYVTRVRTSAAEDAEFMARTGRFAHRGTAGCREGIGYGSTPEQALQNCCYYCCYNHICCFFSFCLRHICTNTSKCC